MRNHVVVVGFGTKGRSAVDTLQNNGTNPAQIVVIDSRPAVDRRRQPPGLRRHRGRRDPARGAAPGGDHQGPRGDHHLGPGRLRDPGHAHRAPAQPQRPRRGGRPRGRQRLAAPAVRGQRGGHLLGGRRPAARPVGGQSQPRHGDRGSAVDARRGWRSASGRSAGTRSASPPDEVRGDRVIAVVRNKTLRRFYDPTVAKLETGDQVVVVRHAHEGRVSSRPTRCVRPSRRH